MKNFKKLFNEALYKTQEENCVLEFVYPELRNMDMEELANNFAKELKKLNVEYTTNYRNINKVLVVCKPDKVDDVKSVGKSMGLTLHKELIPNPSESKHL